ncbi:hypothetical protein Tco_0597475 [Tanacetum coccineum]
MSVFSRLRREGDKPTCRRSPVSTTVFTRLGHRDKNVFTWLGERKKNVHSWIGSEVTLRRRHASERRSASLSKSVEDPGVPRKLLTTKKYIKDPVEIHHIKQREGESTEAFMERFKAESMHVNGAPECMRISRFMHGMTNPDLIKKLNDNIPKSVDKMMNVKTAFLRGEIAAANQSRKKAQSMWRHHETSHKPNFNKQLDFESQHKAGRRQDSSGQENSIVIEAEVEWNLIHHMYVDGRTSWLSDLHHRAMASSAIRALEKSKQFCLQLTEWYLAFGRHLEEIHVTWAHLEKKRTRLRTNTKTLEDLCSQSLATASPVLHDTVKTHLVTASQPFLTASARTDSNADLEDSTHDGVTIKKRRRHIDILINTNPKLGF